MKENVEGGKSEMEVQAKDVNEKNQAEDMMAVGGKAMQFHCDYCHRDITGTIRIKCAECEDFDLCVECFSVGVELRSHKSDHAYRVSDCLCFPIIDEDWTADEEVLLLEGIEMFGMGNWKDIAEHVGVKTDRKCEQHYIEDYLCSPTGPLPLSIGDHQKNNKTIEENDSENHSSHQPENHSLDPEKETDHTMDSVDLNRTSPQKSSGEHLDGQTQSNMEEIPQEGKKRKFRNNKGITKEDGRGATSSSSSTATTKVQGYDLAGYMPLRGDFDVEHENDAELILADMEFNPNESPTERELKLNVVAIYNRKLDEREFRKAFVIERNLLDYKKHQQQERRRPKDEREIVAKMRVYARFQTPEEHNELVAGLLAANRLRKRIATLLEYRQMGIRTFVEADEYEAEKKKRQTEVQLRKERQSAPHIYGDSRTTTSGRDRTNRWLNRERNPEPPTETTNGENHERTRVKKKEFDIQRAQGAHLLSEGELALCQRLEMMPKHFFVVKDLIIREHLSMGTFNPDNKDFQLDVVRLNSIYDFMIETALIKKRVHLDGMTNKGVDDKKNIVKVSEKSEEHFNPIVSEESSSRN